VFRRVGKSIIFGTRRHFSKPIFKNMVPPKQDSGAVPAHTSSIKFNKPNYRFSKIRVHDCLKLAKLANCSLCFYALLYNNRCIMTEFEIKLNVSKISEGAAPSSAPP